MSVSPNFFALAIRFGVHDIKDLYIRTVLGPLWNSAGLAVQVAAIGLVFSLVFQVSLSEYFPFLVVSLVLWGYLVSTSNETAMAFIVSERLLKELALPYYFPIIRAVTKNALGFLHNGVPILIVFVVFPRNWDWGLLLVIPGLLVFAGNLVWTSTLFAFLSTRFRDFPPFLNMAFTAGFYATPVIWMPSSLPNGIRDSVLMFNPVYHLMELTRGPLLGYSPTLVNWLVGIVMLVAGHFTAYIVAQRFWRRVFYWL